jgi:hypothetical protein
MSKYHLIVDDNATCRLVREGAAVVGRVAGVLFREDPEQGDEAGLWATWRGESVQTDYFDLPTPAEVGGDPEAFLAQYRA